MTQPDTLSIPELRAHASELRRQANDIDRHIDALLNVVRLSQGLALPAARQTPATKPVMKADEGVTQAKHGEQIRSKRHGIVTGKWLAVLRALAGVTGNEPFPIERAVSVVEQEHGKQLRAADLRRQFQPYLDSGYLELTRPDEYRFVAKGFAKIGVSPPAANQQSDAPNENEASEADATDASETARDALAEGDHRNVEPFFRVAGAATP